MRKINTQSFYRRLADRRLPRSAVSIDVETTSDPPYRMKKRLIFTVLAVMATVVSAQTQAEQIKFDGFNQKLLFTLDRDLSWLVILSDRIQTYDIPQLAHDSVDYTAANEKLTADLFGIRRLAGTTWQLSQNDYRHIKGDVLKYTWSNPVVPQSLVVKVDLQLFQTAEKYAFLDNNIDFAFLNYRSALHNYFPASIPEPSTMLLLGLGLAGLAAIRRRA